MKMKRLKSIIGVLCILTIFFTLILMVIASYIKHNQDEDFTLEKWNSYSWNDRQQLIKSFIKQYDLNTMTKEEIIKLLGQDTAFYVKYSISYKTDDNLVYAFGAQEHDAASNISLIITFDESDHVASYELKTYSQ